MRHAKKKNTTCWQKIRDFRIVLGIPISMIKHIKILWISKSIYVGSPNISILQQRCLSSVYCNLAGFKAISNLTLWQSKINILFTVLFITINPLLNIDIWHCLKIGYPKSLGQSSFSLVNNHSLVLDAPDPLKKKNTTLW